jgi:hypothetical protein
MYLVGLQLMQHPIGELVLALDVRRGADLAQHGAGDHGVLVVPQQFLHLLEPFDQAVHPLAQHRSSGLRGVPQPFCGLARRVPLLAALFPARETVGGLNMLGDASVRPAHQRGQLPAGSATGAAGQRRVGEQLVDRSKQRLLAVGIQRGDQGVAGVGLPPGEEAGEPGLDRAAKGPLRAGGTDHPGGTAIPRPPTSTSPPPCCVRSSMPPALAYAPVPEIDLPEVDLLAAFQAHTARLGLHGGQPGQGRPWVPAPLAEPAGLGR